MKRPVKAKAKRGAARDLFAELNEGMEALAEARHGKRTLRTHALEYRPAPTVTPRELIRVRKDLKLSRALFAVYLRTNVRTLENWEQGRAQAECGSRATDQSVQALSGHSQAARDHLMLSSTMEAPLPLNKGINKGRVVPNHPGFSNSSSVSHRL